MRNIFGQKLDLRKILTAVLGADIVEMQNISGNLYLRVKSCDVLRCMTVLATHTETLFSSLMDCFAVDNVTQKSEYEIYLKNE